MNVLLWVLLFGLDLWIFDFVAWCIGFQGRCAFVFYGLVVWNRILFVWVYVVYTYLVDFCVRVGGWLFVVVYVSLVCLDLIDGYLVGVFIVCVF